VAIESQHGSAGMCACRDVAAVDKDDERVERARPGGAAAAAAAAAVAVAVAVAVTVAEAHGEHGDGEHRYVAAWVHA
jgi:hypothetical protein